MAQDALQIALEHHRAGRLRQAEAGYRAILENDSLNPDALHWLGVMVFQAGRADQAIDMLERAAVARPADPAFWHNLGQACLAAGRNPEAVEAFERTLEIEPGRAEALYALGLALLARKSPGDAEAAIETLQKAIAAGLDSADVYHHYANALLADGRDDAAIDACRQAIDRRSDFAAAYHTLALAHRRKNNPAEIRKCLLKAVELDPQLARAWCALAILDAEAGKLDIAAALFNRAIKARPDFTAAYTGLARVLQALDKPADAMKAYEQAMRASRGELGQIDPTLALPAALEELERRLTDPQLATLHYVLAEQSDVFPPDRVPARLVASLFDHYAESFDKHLSDRLQYRVPELLAEALLPLLPGRPIDVLDLGCGTGLCGPLLRPVAASLAGVDLSPAMIEKAKERGVYDRLEVGELIEAMHKAPQAYDLLVAADVLIYFGDFAPTFEAAAIALRPGGLLAFSVEAGTGERYQFNKKTRRFTHAASYLRRLAQMHGFVEVLFQEIVGRTEARQPVPGYLIVLQWNGR